jgi:REP element-mobilizing transposase RayT
MPNHFHLLVKTRDEEEIRTLLKPNDNKLIDGKTISKQFSNFFSSYTQSFNKMYERKGSLFMKNFKRKQIQNDSYFTKVIHYIHLNPVHHGFVKNIEDWQWSSYHSFITDRKTLLERDEVLKWFYGKDEYLKFHQNPIEKKLVLEMEF